MLETNCTVNQTNTFVLRSPKAIHLIPGEHGKIWGRLEVEWEKVACWRTKATPPQNCNHYYVTNAQSYRLQIWQVYSQGPSEPKFWRKGSVGISRDCRNFLSTQYYLRNGYSYELQILYAHSQDRSRQKHILNFGKSSRGHTQGFWKIFRAPICRAHRTVIFAVAQLSCSYILV